MMYVSVRRARIAVDSREELARRVEDEFVPVLQEIPGFMEYLLIGGEHNLFMTVSVFRDREGAEESNRVAAEWLRNNVTPMMISSLEFTTGEVLVRAMAAPFTE